MTKYLWSPLTEDGNVRWLKYSFGPGTANTMAIRDTDGAWVVISPSTKTPSAALDALVKEGQVKALVANNGFHHLGQAQWRERFPHAVSYAPQGALARLKAKAAGIPFQPLGALKTGPGLAFLVPDGLKVPDLLVMANAGDETVWFSGDLVSNTGPEDLALPVRLLFTLVGGGTGFRFNKMPSLVYLKDRAAWNGSVRAWLGAGPSIVLPAHGDPLVDNAAARSLRIVA